MKVLDIMTPNPHHVMDGDTAAHLDEIMSKHNVRHIPVVDAKDRLVGVVSNRDLLAKLPPSFTTLPVEERKYYLELIRMSDFMVREPIVVNESTDLLDAVRKMLDKKVGSLPVVDDSRRLVGIVTGGDFLKALTWVLEGSRPIH